MKPKSFGLKLLALAALIMSHVAEANAATYVTSVDQVWAMGKPSVVSNGSGRKMAVSDGKIYVADHSNAQLVYTDGTEWKTIKLEKSTSPMIASDDAGNLVFTYGNGVGSTLQKDLTFMVLPAGATDLTTSYTFVVPACENSANANEGRNDFISASGDFINGTGTLWFYPGKGNLAGKVVRADVTVDASDATKRATVTQYTGGADDPVSTATELTTSYANVVRGSNGTELLVQKGGGESVAGLYAVNSDGTLTLTKANPYISLMLSGVKVKSGDTQYIVYAAFDAVTSTNNHWDAEKIWFDVMDANTYELVQHSIVVHNPGSSNPYDAYTTSAFAAMWVDAELKVEPGSDVPQLYLYGYIPQVGAWKYRMNVFESKPLDLTCNIVTQTEGAQPGRQDVELSWNRIPEAKTYVLSYVYSERKQDGSGTIEVHQVLSSGADVTTVTHEDIINTRKYLLAALDADGDTLGKVEKEITAPFIPHVPEWEDLRNYEGYSKTQALWNHTYGYRPDAYNVYRNGEIIAANVKVLNYIDGYVPEGTCEYEIESLYNNHPGETAKSAKRSVLVAPRNLANELYGITELYNYPIYDNADGTHSALGSQEVMKEFYQQDLYRQGAFYNGHWYIAQKWDHYDAGGASASFTGSSADSGGIFRIDANAGSAEAMAASVKKVYNYPKGSNVGIAVDEKGTFFIRDGASSAWSFTNAVTSGRLLQFSEDGETVTYNQVVDLSGVADGSLKMTTRADYYSMTGDAKSGTANLYMCPSYRNTGSVYSSGKDAWQIKIGNGAFKSSKAFTRSDMKDGAAENYAFQLAGREDILHVVRSQGYFNVNTATGAAETVYNTFSRINNAGGVSMWFNDELFVITPQASSSKNTGDFIVAKGTPDPTKLEGDNPKATDPKNVLLAPSVNMVPVISVSQKDGENTVENSNGIWLAVEPHYSADTTGVRAAMKADYADIYLYVPGTRIAKYRLYPYVQLPGNKVALDVKINYEKDSDGNDVDIKSYGATASWEKVVFDGQYELSRYYLELFKEDTKIETHIFDAEGYEINSDGTRLDGAASIINGSKLEYAVSRDDIDASNYTARLTASFADKTNGYEQNSEPSLSTDKTDYEAKASVPEVYIVKENTNRIWQDSLGNRRVNYRIDVDFNRPDFGGGTEYPVTRYTLAYKVKNAADSTSTPMEGLSLMAGGKKPLQHQTSIPGTFDFDNSKYYVVGTEGNKVVCCYYHQPIVNEAGEPVYSNDDPANWTFELTARYADDAVNGAIKKQAVGVATVVHQNTTGVEDVADCRPSADTVYPTLTQGPVTASSLGAIKSVAVYSVSGRQVMSVGCDGEQLVTFDVSHLPSGVYVVSINGGRGCKLVKR